MATIEETVFIKQLMLMEDISFGLKEETQVRSGITVTGNQVNSEHLPHKSNLVEFKNFTTAQLIDALITKTGLTPSDIVVP